MRWMGERLAVECEVTRADWIAANEVILSTSPVWETYARAMRRRAIWTLLWMGPVMVGGTAYVFGTRGATRGMYVEGAIGGAILVVLMSLYTCRLDTYIRAAKREAAKHVHKAEYGDRVGRIRVMIDETSVCIETAARQLRLAWSTVAVHDLDEYVLISHGTGDGIVVPKRAFPTRTEAEAFAGWSQQWWQLGQMPMAERVARYLADRDVRCVTCGYNLRGITRDTCPECGAALTVEELQQAPQR